MEEWISVLTAISLSSLMMRPQVLERVQNAQAQGESKFCTAWGLQNLGVLFDE